MNNTNNNPAKVQRNAIIAQDRLSGMVYSEIAAKHNIDASTVCRVLQDDEIRDILKTGTNNLVSFVPLAIDNYNTFLTDKSHPDHYKASKDTLQNTGVLASHTGGNVYIDKMMVIDNAPKPEDIDRIRDLLQARQETDILEAEVIEDEAA